MRESRDYIAAVTTLCKKVVFRLSQLFKNFHGPSTAQLQAFVKYGLRFPSKQCVIRVKNEETKVG